jgi:hypothetical protein
MRCNGKLSLIFLVLICFSISHEGKAQKCKFIEASPEVVQPIGTQATGSIKINYQGNQQEFKAALIGPKGYFKKDILDIEVTGLKKGMYTLVLMGRKEDHEYCLKPVELTIR